jgi:DNA repair exonuclease SbcCD ATPase subunit
MKTIINNNKKYDKIYHISDIHIRNTPEHTDRYLLVFKKLYEYLYSENVKSSLLVITGDILHTMDKMTSTSEMLCVDFLETLCSITPVIMIPGNHDFNMNNTNTQDTLSSIIYRRKFDKLYYLRESGIYRFNNVVFGVSSLIDKTIITADKIPSSEIRDCIKVALYHGIITNSQNNTGFKMKNKPIGIFNGYDLVLLGDVHKYQYMNKEKTAGYASSLISQNFSETDIYHGVLVWDLQQKTSCYKIIENEYRYEEIEILTQKSLEDTTVIHHNKEKKIKDLILPKNGFLRINSLHLTNKQYKELESEIKKGYPNINIIHNCIVSKTIVDKQNIVNTKEDSQEISIKKIINDEIEKVSQENRENVRRILMSELKETIQTTDERMNWKLLSLEFSNMFSYGEKNKIDFTILTPSEITSLIGLNSVGKSSLIDILLFALFNDYSRNIKEKNRNNNAFININENNFSCVVRFMSGTDIYMIQKSGSKHKAKTMNTIGTLLKPNVIFTKTNENNETISVAGANETETLNNIIKIIGTYEQFCLSALYFQSNYKNSLDFLNMSSCDRLKFLNDNFNTEQFQKIEEKYSIKCKETKTIIATLKNTNDYKNYNEKTDTIIEEYIQLIEEKKEQEEILLKELNIRQTGIMAIYDIKTTIDEQYVNMSTVELEQMINEEEKNITKYEDKSKELSKYNDDNMVLILYNMNIENTSKLEKSTINILDVQEINNMILLNKKLIDELDLIKHKDVIYSEHKRFEEEKMKRLYKLQDMKTNKLKTISASYFNNIEGLKEIYKTIPIYISNIEMINNKLTTLKNNKAMIENKIEEMKNNDLNSFTEDDVKYYNTLDFNRYSIETKKELENYETIEQLYNKLESIKEILIMLDDFNKNVNKDCKNCLLHSEKIYKNVYNGNMNDYIGIKQEYTRVKNIKTQYERIYSYYLYLKMEGYKKDNELISQMILYYNNELENDIKNRNNTSMIEFKNRLDEYLEFFEQNNILIEIQKLENTKDENYTRLNEQIISFEKYKNIIDNCNIQLNNIKINTNIENNNVEIAMYNKNRKLYFECNCLLEKSKEKIKKIKKIILNNELNKEILEYNKDILECNKNIKIVQEEINKNTYNLENMRNKKKAYETVNDKINLLENDYISYSCIKDLMCIKNGIPRKVINIRLKKIVEDVNKISYPFLNKTIEIITDNQYINVYINDGKERILFGGGMETFIFNLSFKLSFMNIFNIPHCGLLILDESVSVLDKNNMNRFDILSQFLKSYYTYIILITHIEGYSEYTCDNKIEVYKIKDRSRVWFCYDEYEENKEEEKDDIQVVISKKRGRKPKDNVIMV